MRRRWIVGFMVLLGGVAIPIRAASAHVALTDDSGRASAVLHIAPDDDPVAGQRSQLHFVLPTTPAPVATARLTITEEATGRQAELATTVDGASVQAEYVFPSQGIYHLRLTAGEYMFNHTLRVTRGTAAQAPAATSPAWPLPVLVLCASLTVALGVIAYNHRKVIAKHSTF